MPWFVEEFRDFLRQVIDEISDFYQWPINKTLNFFWTTTVEIPNFFLEIRDSFSQPIDGVLNVERTDGFCEFFPQSPGENFGYFHVRLRTLMIFLHQLLTKLLIFFYCIGLMKLATSVTDWRNLQFFLRLIGKIWDFSQWSVDEIRKFVLWLVHIKFLINLKGSNYIFLVRGFFLCPY